MSLPSDRSNENDVYLGLFLTLFTQSVSITQIDIDEQYSSRSAIQASEGNGRTSQLEGTGFRLLT